MAEFLIDLFSTFFFGMLVMMFASRVKDLADDDVFWIVATTILVTISIWAF